MTAVAMTLSGHPDVFRACYIAFMNDEPSYHYHPMIGAPLEFFYDKELVRIRRLQEEVTLPRSLFIQYASYVDLCLSRIYPLGTVVELDRELLPKDLVENSKTLHEELIRYIRHYNPETAFDLSQMSEQELQTLGRTISLASHGNGGKKPQELIDFLKGNEVTFEKEITVYDDGQHYLKSKIQIKGHFKGESAITFNTKYKDGKLSQEGEYSVGGLSTDFLDEKANYKTKIGLKDYSITGEFSVADKISSSYGRLAPNLSIGFGYKNRSLEVGTKSEDGYRVTYVKEHNQVKQDYGTVKTTTETGVRTVDHLTQTFNTTGEVVGSAFNWVVEHPVETIGLTLVTVGTILAFSTGVGEVATAVVALFVGITALFNS
ncbi:hypothetical protein B7721_01145 [Streptococcus oralis subsp. oralis]|uniref:Uncharacterized protein n=1 Tax=Streptococcus oralis subsp. oralis TaxID=1891914 RepID=A0A1X1HA07_STROR|nr:hypothetical protein [Streptococcus oralis]ORO57422.1 hypothetical protein B7721_01145 [Streptococcus oralis subsp. oralis]